MIAGGQASEADGSSLARGTAESQAGVLVTPPGHDTGMARQLVLIDTRTVDWRLDEHTRELGRKGVAEARRKLLEATQRRAA